MVGACGLFTTEPPQLRLKLTSDYGVTHAYQLLSQTCSGTVGTTTLNVSASLSTSSLMTGSVFHVGPSFHEYTAADVTDVIITTTTPLIQTYNAGTGLRADVISQAVSSEGFGSIATQSSVANQPAFLPHYVNGLDAIGFHTAAKVLSVANNPLTDNIFATGGTVIGVLGVDTAGGNGAGRFLEKSIAANTLAWNLISTTAAGGYYRLLFDIVTSGTSGSFTTNSVLQLNVPQIFSIEYDNSDISQPPIIRVQGVQVGVNTTSTPDGIVVNDSGGNYFIGNSLSGGRGLDGRFLALYLCNTTFTDYQHYTIEKYLAAKYNSPLFQLATQYYGGRQFIITRPDDLTKNYPLIIYLHGGGGSGFSFVQQLQIGPIMGQVAINCFPTATRNNGVDQANTWNSNNPPPTFNQAPDTTYLSDLADYIVSLGNVDTSQIYLVGHSNGAMMSYRLCIDHPEKFAGCFIMAGDVMVNNPNTYTGRIKALHGQSDQNVPLAGGIGINGNYYPPVIPTVSLFTKVNGGNGIVASSDLTDSFTVLPTPAAHEVATLKTALGLAPYSTTLPQVIFNFIFDVDNSNEWLWEDGSDMLWEDDDYIKLEG